ncbi:MAG: vitamin K epoxide reductase family protein [Vulcanimicrobiaceae bacterium]
MFFKVTILVLCGVGLYASAFMGAKAGRAARGRIDQPSVVMTPRARALGVPNAWFGLAYYALLAAATPLLGIPAIWWAALGASLAAAAFSLFLAYSLLFVTRMPCVYCWTSHAVNWLLPLLLLGARH